MKNHLLIDGKKYLSTREASRITGYSSDYIGQLSRTKKIDSKLIGRAWYIEEKSLIKYKNLGLGELSKFRSSVSREPHFPRSFGNVKFLKTASLSFATLAVIALVTLNTPIKDVAQSLTSNIKQVSIAQSANVIDSLRSFLRTFIGGGDTTTQVALNHATSASSATTTFVTNKIYSNPTTYVTYKSDTSYVDSKVSSLQNQLDDFKNFQSRQTDAIFSSVGTSIADAGVSGGLVNLSSFTTGDLAEGSNLYFTNTRVFDSLLSSASTTFGGNVVAGAFYGDGSYLTGISAGSAFSTSTTRGAFSATSSLTYDSANGVFGISTSTLGLSTSDIAEGSQLYYTADRFDTRLAATTSLPNLTTLAGLSSVGTITSGVWNGTAIDGAYLANSRGLFSNSATGLTYDSLTGLTSLTSGYNIPLTASTTEWAAKTSSQWTTSASNIYYTTGNVGIGSTSPSSLLTVSGNSYLGGNVTVTGTVLLPLASASAPAIKFGSSVNTGIYGTGVDSGISFAVGGAEKFRVSNGELVYVFANSLVNTGRFFMGMAQDVALSRNAAGVGEITNGTSGTWRDLIVRNLSMGTTSTSTTLTVQGAAGKNPFSIASSTGTNLFTVTQAGNVGIGSSTPSAPLSFSNAIGDKINLGQPGSNPFLIRVANSTDLELTANGSLYFSSGAVGSQTFKFNNNGSQVNAGTAAQLTLYSSSDSTGLDMGVRKTSLPSSSYIYSAQGGGVFPTTNWGDLLLGPGNQSNGQVFIGRNAQLVVGATNISIGTSTPWAKFSLQQANGSRLPLFDIASTTSSTFATSSLFTVLPSGNVGIGVSNPSQMLSVYGSNPTLFLNTNSLNTGTSSILFGTSGSSNTFGSGILAQTTGASGNQNLYIVSGFGSAVSPANAQIAITSAGTRINGPFGINSTPVANQLNLAPSSGNQFNLNVVSASNSGIAALNFSHFAGGAIPAGIYSKATGAGGYSEGINFAVNPTNNSAGISYTGLDTKLFIAPGGQVGIGTKSNTPSGMLSIQGTSTLSTIPLLTIASSTGTNLLTVANTGNVGIGSSTPAYGLSVAGTVGFSGLTNAAFGNYLCIDASNQITSGTTCSTSGGRFKDNVQNLNLGLSTVLALRPVTFNFKKGYGDNGTTDQLGFVAEEANTIDPRLVPHDENGLPTGFNYANYTAVLTKAIQEQQVQINALKNATSSVVVQQTLVAATTSTTTVALELQESPSFITTIADAVKNIISSAGEFVVSTIRSTLAVFDRVETRTAAVSQGLEMKDQTTGTIYCVMIKNGDWDKKQGTCAEVASASSTPPVVVQNPTPVVVAPIVITPDPIATSTPVIATSTPAVVTSTPDIATSTPEIIATSTPEIVIEPVATSTPEIMPVSIDNP